MNINIPDPKPGDPLRAEHIKALLELRDRLTVSVAPPLAQAPDGTIYLPDGGGFWAKITGAPSSGKHPWLEQIPQTGGTWTDGVRTGTTSTDPAYEANGSTSTLTNKKVWLRRDKASGELRFVLTC